MRKLVGNVTSVVPLNWSRTVCPRHAARLNERCVYAVALAVALRLLKAKERRQYDPSVRAASVPAVLAALCLAGSSPARDGGSGLPLRIQVGEARALKVVLPAMNAPFVSVGAVGDVNGDGRGDFSVRAVQGHAGDARRTFVVFGSAALTIPAHRLRASGYELAGGAAATGVGDLDRDGYDDVVGSGCNGTLTVIYGSRARGVATLDTRGNKGYRITGLRDCVAAVSGAHNARRHLLAGSCGAVRNAPSSAYLLPPRPRGTARVHAPSAATSRIIGSRFVCPIGLGDVNGDRRDDAVVSDGTGSIFVVFDALRMQDVRLGSLGRRGFRIWATRDPVAVALVGDVNGDRRADIVIGDRKRAAAYVVFGKSTSTPVETATLGVKGLTIRGERNVSFPYAASAAGDVNGDGLADVLLGAPFTLPGDGGEVGGSAFVVYGRRFGGELSVATPGTGALRIDGRHEGSTFGLGGSVASVADLDGDGRRELAIAGGYEGVAHVLLSSALRR